jgi:3-oxoacyl-[acyl-carrier-protein] synthase II
VATWITVSAHDLLDNRNLLGVAGVLEAVFCVKSLETSYVLATINQEVPDPECGLDYIPNQARGHSAEYAMSVSLGFGRYNVERILADPKKALADW